MPNRYSDVNNCPTCRRRLWLRKRNGVYYYNCLQCGYQAVLENPGQHKLSTVEVQQLSFLIEEEDDAAA